MKDDYEEDGRSLCHQFVERLSHGANADQLAQAGRRGCFHIAVRHYAACKSHLGRLPDPKGRLSDRSDGVFNYTHEETITLAAGRIMVIDFKAATGGFIFRNKNTTLGQ